ncbi:MAG: chemotaxis protein CheX [Phycisphaerae bacterium]
MDVKLINPFVESVDTVFRTMVGATPVRKPVRIADGFGNRPCLTSIVGISGRMSGVVVLRFPPPTAKSLAGRMLGADPPAGGPEVVDAVAEVVNMVAGAAKAKFESDPPLQLGLPTVVEGAEYRVKYPSKSVWLEVPFDSELGEFSLEITFESNGGGAK